MSQVNTTCQHCGGWLIGDFGGDTHSDGTIDCYHCGQRTPALDGEHPFKKEQVGAGHVKIPIKHPDRDGYNVHRVKRIFEIRRTARVIWRR